ncbi:hypothetical protein [Sphingobium yanoikuyae]|jgi:hypothetical protein|uniref:hypothetical protein n=1 Tax=Sphingobium TaxID=165695 RepID=UPI0028A8FBBB|nr:hypothetical protein [Sphingobium yanoikuyae]
MTDTAAYVIGFAIAFATIVISAAIRPSFLRGYWITLRAVIWVSIGYFMVLYCFEAILLVFGNIDEVSYMSERGLTASAGPAIGIALTLGTISLIARLIAGPDRVPWFFDKETDTSIVWGAAIWTMWAVMAAPVISHDFFGRTGPALGADTSAILIRLFVYGFAALLFTAVVVSGILNQRQRSSYLRREAEQTGN